MSVTLHHMRRAAGLVFLAPQTGIRDDGTWPTSLTAQAELALARITALLATDCLELVDVVHLTCRLAQGADEPSLREALATLLPQPLLVVDVSMADDLPAGCLVELEAVADER